MRRWILILAIAGLGSCDEQADVAVKTGERARILSANGTLRKIAVSLDQWRAQKGSYPATLDEMIEDRFLPGGQAAITDPWGMFIRYETDGSLGFVLTSSGPDMEELTDDDIEYVRDQ